ncbi:unnamed protein product [Linum trigynum]|uniref:Uncharacterized protein n=1 Tax=Linum trigynum TaxID=586398 RepID=A0AAV2DUM5_9ROSI
MLCFADEEGTITRATPENSNRIVVTTTGVGGRTLAREGTTTENLCFDGEGTTENSCVDGEVGRRGLERRRSWDDEGIINR